MGIGPGDTGFLSQRGRNALTRSQVIIGYATYIKLLGNLVKNKEVISFGMTQEIKRAKLAIKKVLEGKRVCLVSSGDPGIYGIAGVVLELLGKDDESKVDIEVIPGIPASASCASLLGAPLMHDFVTISLSDLLTDKGLIEKRVKLAAQGDFVIVFYNPKSKKRTALLKEAWRILMKYKSPQTPVGIVRNAYRDNEEVQITKLKDMLDSKIIDMVTTIIVGNSKTYIKGTPPHQNFWCGGKYMITPRGYNLPQKECP